MLNDWSYIAVTWMGWLTRHFPNFSLGYNNPKVMVGHFLGNFGWKMGLKSTLLWFCMSADCQISPILPYKRIKWSQGFEVVPSCLTFDDLDLQKWPFSEISNIWLQIFKVKFTYGEGQPNFLKMVPNCCPYVEVSQKGWLTCHFFNPSMTFWPYFSQNQTFLAPEILTFWPLLTLRST